MNKDKKQALLDDFLSVIQQTVEGEEICDLKYDDSIDKVHVVFVTGYQIAVCRDCDSGVAMMYDILKYLLR